MRKGKFITVEGTEGAGKSTALKFIQDFLEQNGKQIVLTREPGGTPFAEEVRNLLLHAKTTEKIEPETELLLMFAGRVQHIAQCILPTLQTGKWIVSDRYIDASYAYQGGGRGISHHYIHKLDRLAVGHIYPDLTLLLDIPADLGMQRAEKRGVQKDRIEQERMDFFVRVRQAYLDRAKQDPNRIKIIDASKSLADVETQIHQVLTEFLVNK